MSRPRTKPLPRDPEALESMTTRLKVWIFKRILEEAKINHRSANAEINMRLGESFKPTKPRGKQLEAAE